jgi:hypothetical protein
MSSKQQSRIHQRRAEKRNRRASEKKAEAKRVAARTISGGRLRLIQRPLGMRKLSDVMWEYAEPLLADATGPEDRAVAIKMAILLWNATLVGRVEARTTVLAAIRKAADGDPEAETGLLDIARVMEERKRLLFADDRRLVVDHMLTETATGPHLMVISTPLDAQTPSRSGTPVDMGE